jgi:hypothetical protein
MRILVNFHPMTNIRTQNISNARNLLLSTIRQDADHREFAYFMMIDCDEVCGRNMNLQHLDKFVNPVNNTTITSAQSWDSISFNRGDYYDIWAFSNDPCVASCWNWENRHTSHMWTLSLKKWIIDELAKLGPDDLMPCYSAFNGFALYRMSTYIDCHYEWNMQKVMEFIPQEWINKQFSIIKKPFFMSVGDCEHRFFHIQAVLEKGAKNWITPLCLFDEDPPTATTT